MTTKSIKPGAFQTGRTKGGLNLNKFIKDVLVSMGLAGTENCCDYFPTYPVLEVANIGNPSEQEMVNVPLGSMFKTVNEDGNTYYLFIKTAPNIADVIFTND